MAAEIIPYELDIKVIRCLEEFSHLDELADICRKIDAGIKKAKEDFEATAYPDLSNRIQRYMEGIKKAEALLSRNINWFEMNLKSSGIKEAYETVLVVQQKLM